MSKEKLATAITLRWQNQGIDVYRLNKKLAEHHLEWETKCAAARGGTLVVRHVQKASNASCGEQRNCGHMG